MPADLVKCASKNCVHRGFYPNQLIPVDTGCLEYPEPLMFCPDCYTKLMRTCGDKGFVGCIYKMSCPMDEANRIRKERALAYARSEVGA